MLKDLLKSMKSFEWTSSGKIGGSSENPEEHYQFQAAFALSFLWFTWSWHSRAVEQHERKILKMIYKAKPQYFVKLSLELCWKLDGFLKGAGKYDTKVCKAALLWLPQKEAQSLETSPTAKAHQRTWTSNNSCSYMCNLPNPMWRNTQLNRPFLGRLNGHRGDFSRALLPKIYWKYLVPLICFENLSCGKLITPDI